MNAKRLRGVVLAAAILLACGTAIVLELAPIEPTASGFELGITPPSGIPTIGHVILVMQENRSFDNYFGTFPGADGIPMSNGRPTVCVPDPQLGHCVRPFHDPYVVDGGGPHTMGAARTDIHGGGMNGFVRSAL